MSLFSPYFVATEVDVFDVGKLKAQQVSKEDIVKRNLEFYKAVDQESDSHRQLRRTVRFSLSD